MVHHYLCPFIKAQVYKKYTCLSIIIIIIIFHKKTPSTSYKILQMRVSQSVICPTSNQSNLLSSCYIYTTWETTAFRNTVTAHTKQRRTPQSGMIIQTKHNMLHNIYSTYTDTYDILNQGELNMLYCKQIIQCTLYTDIKENLAIRLEHLSPLYFTQ